MGKQTHINNVYINKCTLFKITKNIYISKHKNKTFFGRDWVLSLCTSVVVLLTACIHIRWVRVPEPSVDRLRVHGIVNVLAAVVEPEGGATIPSPPSPDTALTLQDSPGSSTVTAGLLPSALSKTQLFKNNILQPSEPFKKRVRVFSQYGRICLHATARSQLRFIGLIYVCGRISTRHGINHT